MARPERFQRAERRKHSAKVLPRIGWREWVVLPELSAIALKAKVCSATLASSLHAFDWSIYTRNRKKYVRFRFHPHQRDSTRVVDAAAPLLEERRLGGETLPVIVTDIEAVGRRWTVDLVLVAKEESGFRLLLGRRALRGRFLVDPGRSYAGGQPKT